MTTRQFINLLQQHSNHELLFEYKSNQFAGTNYHLTEIKNVHFETVDCGGNTNEWNETQIQIWESPNEVNKTNFMTSEKFLSIIQKVNSIKSLSYDTEVKIEYGNDTFHTSVMKIKSFTEKNNQLIIQLFEEKTLCKAPSELPENENESSCCNTSSGCC